MDLTYALRGLKKNPGFAAAIVITLALGIGANAAMFSVVDRLLFRAPAMLRDPELTHRVYLTRSFRGKPSTSNYMAYKRYRDITEWTTSFARTAQVSLENLAVGTGSDALEMNVAAVSAPFFNFFVAAPAIGRYFTTAEDTTPAGAAVAVLSYGLWQTRYGGDPKVIGKQIQIGATEYTIIGVTPRGFTGIWNGTPPAAYVPISTYGAEITMNMHINNEPWYDTYHMTFSYMIAQRKPDVSVERANADVSAAYQKSFQVALDRDHRVDPEAKPKAQVASILAERGPNESSDGKVATWILGVAVIVWLIACANVANLLLARALRRRREIAVRLALGVTRLRLAKQLLTESLLLGAMGGVMGIVFAQWGGAALRAAFLPKGAEASVVADPRTLVFAGVAALVAGFVTGLVPVFQSTRADLTADLKAGAREGTVHRSRTRVALLVFQGALSVVLLVGAGLFVRSLRNVEGMRLGYEPDRVLQVELQMRGVSIDSAHAVQLRRDLLDAARAIPGVDAASLSVTIPFWSSWSTELHVAGIDSVNKLGEFLLNYVSPAYFSVMGTRIVRGRGFGDVDALGAPRAIIVTEAMAKALWPGKDALGQCVKVGADTVPCSTVIGVAENVRAQSIGGDDPGFFFWLSQVQRPMDNGGLVLRMAHVRAADRETVRKSLQALMPGVSYVTVTPFADVIGGEMKSWKLGATMFTLFGALALVLAAIGMYSVIAYNVTQRTHELGVRVALGATVRDIVRLVVGEGVRVAAAGVVMGCVIALAASRWLAPLLFQESARDPLVYGGVVAVLAIVAVLASIVPARRASAVEPMRALRVE